MKRIGVGLALGLVALAGCAPTEQEPAPVATLSSPTVAEQPSAEPSVESWPLLGVETNDDGDAAEPRPIVGVKIENSREARPWVGLAQADVVFVEMVEGGLTRFHAIYNSSYPDEVGPVRSLRPMDAAILGPWGGTLLASGGQQIYIDRIESVADVRTFDAGDSGFSRESGRRAPHNVMFTLADEAPGFDSPETVPPLAEYGIPSSEGGQTADTIRLDYPQSVGEWEWSGEVWQRSDDGSASEEVDGTRIEAANVVVLEVEVRDSGLLDAAGSPVPETILEGSGSLHLFADGQMVEGEWSKLGDADPFVLTDADGEPLVLAPGRTWVELLPVSGSLTWDDATD